ncbi:MAG: hypothetical protein SFU91_06495 [Chloroherpetonaceae bacterium]|nr:hypothetical protein [Chloroherpetonaceae bacterium]
MIRLLAKKNSINQGFSLQAHWRSASFFPLFICLSLLLLISINTMPSLAQIPRMAKEKSVLHPRLISSFAGEQPVYLRAEVLYSNRETEGARVMIYPILKRNDTLEVEFKIPPGAANITFAFASIDSIYPQVFVTRVLSETGELVEQANLFQGFTRDDTKELLYDEIFRYPSSLEATIRLWEFLEEEAEDNQFREEIERTLKKIELKRQTSKILFASSVGYLYLGNITKAIDAFRILTAQFPKSHYIPLLYDFFLKRGEESSIRRGALLKPLSTYIFQKGKTEDIFELLDVFKDTSVTAEELKDLYKKQEQLFPDVPIMHAAFGILFKTKAGLSVESIEAFEKSRFYLFHPSAGYFFDASFGEINRSLFSLVHREMLGQCIDANRLDRAEELIDSLKYKPKLITPELLGLEGRVFFLKKNFARAERAYMTAHKKNLEWAKDGVRDCYLAQNPNRTEADFDTYFRRLERTFSP